jgi:hypothetical protein
VLFGRRTVRAKLFALLFVLSLPSTCCCVLPARALDSAYLPALIVRLCCSVCVLLCAAALCRRCTDIFCRSLITNMVHVFSAVFSAGGAVGSSVCSSARLLCCQCLLPLVRMLLVRACAVPPRPAHLPVCVYCAACSRSAAGGANAVGLCVRCAAEACLAVGVCALLPPVFCRLRPGSVLLSLLPVLCRLCPATSCAWLLVYSCLRSAVCAF